MKRKLGFVTALVFAVSLGLSAAFARSSKPATERTGQQGMTTTASTSMKSGMKKMMSNRRYHHHYCHHRKSARRVKYSERERKEKKEKEGTKERS